MANKKKSSLMQTLVIVGAALLCFGGYYLYAGKYADSIQFKNPAGKATQYYEKHKYVYDIWSLPTKMDYYLLPPAEIYDDVKYPLMVILHGGTGKAYAAGFMAEDYYREKYPGYVLVPVVPPNHVWWSPYQTPPKGFENALPYAVDIVRKVSNELPIDKGRIYVVGCSMGGGGAIAASLYYQDVFAGAAAMGSYIDPRPIPEELTTPLVVYHGRNDADAPVEAIRATVGMLKKAGDPVFYKEYENAGHNCPMRFFYPDEMWDWLYNLQKPELR
jgi:predicted peptidase